MFFKSEIQEALKQGGCPICILSRRSLNNYYFWLLHQNYSVLEHIQELQRAGGLCKDHARPLLEVRSEMTTYCLGIMYQYILQFRVSRLLALLTQLKKSNSGGWFFLRGVREERLQLTKSSFRKREICPACKYQRLQAGYALQDLAEQLGDAEIRELYDHSPGLCLDHLSQGIELLPDNKLLGLLEVQAKKLLHLESELAEFLRKFNYIYREEPKGEEQTSWIRAIRWCAGGGEGV